MDIHSYGVASVSTAVIWKGNRIITPFATNLSVLNLSTFEREQSLQHNQCSIRDLTENSKYIFSVSANGEVAVVDKADLKCLGVFKTNIGYVSLTQIILKS